MPQLLCDSSLVKNLIWVIGFECSSIYLSILQLNRGELVWLNISYIGLSFMVVALLRY